MFLQVDPSSIYLKNKPIRQPVLACDFERLLSIKIWSRKNDEMEVCSEVQ